VLSLVLLVLLAGALLAVNVGLRGRSRPSMPVPGADPGSAAPSSAPLAAGTPAAPVASALAPAGRPTPASAPRAQRLVVKALEPTWLRVQIDGGGSVQELLPAGASREWSAEERFVLTVGNAGGLQLELNGRTLPPLGERGAVIRELVLPQGAASTGS
jgi:cytoskeleton protein RodZ